MKFSRYPASAVLALLAPTLNSAATRPSESDFTMMSLEDLGSIKVPTVVGASKHEQKITEAPSAVSIVTAEDIKLQGHRTLADILRGVRGFYVSYDRGYHAIGARGVNRPGDYGGRLLITVNGHRINDPVYDTAASGLDFILDVDLIERVEVIRGPGSSLYGNNAFLGVINVVTRKASASGGTEIAGSAATFDTYNGRLSYARQFASGVELTLSGTLNDSAGERRLYYPEFSAINGGVAEDMDANKTRSGFARIAWRGFALEGGFVRHTKTWPTAAYSTEEAIVIFNDPRFVVIDERAYANLSFRHSFADAWMLETRAYVDHYQLDALYPYDYLDENQPVYLNADFARSRSIGGELQLSKTFFQKHRVIVGAELRRDLKLEQRNADLDPPETYLDTQNSGHFLAFYAQNEVQVRKNLLLNVGLRYDTFSTFGGTLNPRAALIYQPRKESTYKLLYGQAFRAPNGYENYYETAIANKRNPELGPETIRSFEVVHEEQLGRNWRTTTAVFYNKIKGLIGYREDPTDGLYFFDNLDEVVSKGAEFEVEGAWDTGARGRMSYTYTHSRDVATGLRLSNSPEHMGKLSLSVPLQRDRVFASFELQGMSSRNTSRNEGVGAFWVTNATIFSRELRKGLELTASVYNLFDRRYSDPVAEDFKQDSVPQVGRSLRLKIAYRF